MSVNETHANRRLDTRVMDPRETLDIYLRPMRAFAMCLTRDRAKGEDLLHATILKVWAKIDTFKPGAHLGIWLFSIERGIYYAQGQSQLERTVEGTNGGSVETTPGSKGESELADFRRAFDCLPDELREALTLVGAAGFSHRQAAEICGCSVGILTNRAKRGRDRLAKILSLEQAESDSCTEDASRGFIGKTSEPSTLR